jgi:hypothetical protein
MQHEIKHTCGSTFGSPVPSHSAGRNFINVQHEKMERAVQFSVNNNNNNQVFYSQTSWGRLEMKPHKKNRYKTRVKKKGKTKGDTKTK